MMSMEGDNNNNYEIVTSDLEQEDNNNNNNSELSNRPACAACKHQRKKCQKAKCAMLKHFPAEKYVEFQRVHRVFGIANLTRMLQELNKGQQEEAVKSVEWEALWWKNDPEHGPLGQFKKLEQKLEKLEEENFMLKARLQALTGIPSPVDQSNSYRLPFQPIGAGNIRTYYTGNLPLPSSVNNGCNIGFPNRGESSRQAGDIYGSLFQPNGGESSRQAGYFYGTSVFSQRNHGYNFSVPENGDRPQAASPIGSHGLPQYHPHGATYPSTNNGNGELQLLQQTFPINSIQNNIPSKS